MPGPKLSEKWTLRVYITNVMLLFDCSMYLILTPITRFSKTGRCMNHPMSIWD
jgi:hypothetical protein